MPATGKTTGSLGQTIGRHHVRFFLKNICSSKVLSAIKHSSFFAPSVPSTLCPAHALLRDDPAQSSATVTADFTPVDLFTASLPHWARYTRRFAFLQEKQLGRHRPIEVIQKYEAESREA
ncbi:uncharacterized protein F5891DRAFT_987769 [Suillus fuscotomentosus]|uniref:Uncharacterized protein n=1 Tax=Suillus fuscotomentosus TaxID=1912939 RepID=A0AAD4HCZ9_9AGAM|nr:uncharacterized protein F5891DRAFT_987769 [Suillus fuscotomentosus]KAG1888477.1 hypothetical protein F5891DRAFT_987769 [Suillus fuscotomentosus]